MDNAIYVQRLQALAAAAHERGWAGLAIGTGDDLRWATGSTISSHERLTLLCIPARPASSPKAPGSGDDADQAGVTLIVPKLELAALAGSVLTAQEAAAAGITVQTWVDGEDPHALAVASLGTGAVGVDDDLPARHLLPLLERGWRPQAGVEIIGQQRMVKDPAEQDELRQISAAIDRVHRRMPEFLRVGLTEREAADLISAAMLAEGHQEVAFAIVGSAAHGADPHHEVSEKVLEAGDIVVVDIGGPAPSGYGSDCTRTYVLGDPDPEAARMIEILERAQAAGRAAARPGATCGEVDAACRDILTDAGLGDYFIHRTGHGIGISAHEAPFVVGGSEQRLDPGMAITIEPGIYLPGRFGARIEDVVLITDDGCEPLNTTDHGLTQLPAA